MSRIGDSASVQAATKVNAEQISKRTMRRPTQRLAARATHWALYGLLVVRPFVGWAATSAYGAQIVVFGFFKPK